MMENTAVAHLPSSLHRAEPQLAKAVVPAGAVASWSLQKPAAFLHEELELAGIGLPQFCLFTTSGGRMSPLTFLSSL